MILHELHFLLSSAYLTAHISPLPKCPQQGNVSSILHCIVWIQSTSPSVSLTAAMCPEMKRMLINTAASRIYLKISITSNCNHSSFDVRTLSKQRTHEPPQVQAADRKQFPLGCFYSCALPENKINYARKPTDSC